MDEGLYVNMGPGRLPHHHYRILHYCRMLGVKLEPYVMETAANIYSQTAGTGASRTLPNRQITHDTQGYVADLLAKAVNKGALDAELDLDERRQIIDLLKAFGDLDEPGGSLGAVSCATSARRARDTASRSASRSRSTARTRIRSRTC